MSRSGVLYAIKAMERTAAGSAAAGAARAPAGPKAARRAAAPERPDGRVLSRARRVLAGLRPGRRGRHRGAAKPSPSHS